MHIAVYGSRTGSVGEGGPLRIIMFCCWLVLRDGGLRRIGGRGINFKRLKEPGVFAHGYGYEFGILVLYCGCITLYRAIKSHND